MRRETAESPPALSSCGLVELPDDGDALEEGDEVEDLKSG